MRALRECARAHVCVSGVATGVAAQPQCDGVPANATAIYVSLAVP